MPVGEFTQYPEDAMTWTTTTPAERIWVCKAGNAVLCAFADAEAASGWCEESNRNGAYKAQGTVYAVEVWLNR